MISTTKQLYEELFLLLIREKVNSVHYVCGVLFYVFDYSKAIGQYFFFTLKIILLHSERQHPNGSLLALSL